MTKPWQKVTWERKVLLSFPFTFVTREIRQEDGSRNWSRDHWQTLLTGLILLYCSTCFLLYPKPSCPGMAFSTLGTSVILMRTTQNHAPKSSRLLTSGKDNYSIEIFLSHLMTICLKLPKLNQQSPQNESVRSMWFWKENCITTQPWHPLTHCLWLSVPFKIKMRRKSQALQPNQKV